MAVYAERRAGQDNQVSILSDFERTNAILEVEHFRRVDG